MSLSFLRSPSILNNTISNTFRKRSALSFRKTLGVYNYKVKPAQYYKNPHAISLKIKEKLKSAKTDSAIRKIHALERLSNTPFGRFTSKGRFIFNSLKVPNYNIPDVIDFHVFLF